MVAYIAARMAQSIGVMSSVEALERSPPNNLLRTGEDYLL
jgi:hypothetical protein